MRAIGVFMMSKPVSAYEMGESYARNMGLNVRAFRILLVLLSSILAACVTAFAGPVSFVGIAVPHLVKKLLGTSRPILLIPACFLGGSVFCLVCDLLARTLFAPTELSISTVTAVIRGTGGYLYHDPPKKRKGGVAMDRDYFYTESLTSGLSGCPIDQKYCHWIEKGGNPDIDRSEWCR